MVPVDLRVKYVDYSKYQFLISVEFKERVTSPFKMVVRFNDEFRKCLGDQNYNQQLEIFIDPATLIIQDETGTLQF